MISLGSVRACCGWSSGRWTGTWRLRFEDIFQGGSPEGFQFGGDLGDLFKQFAGGTGQGRGAGRGRSRGPVPGADLSAELTVPFNTAVLGGQATIQVQRSGKYESLQVKIPAGVETGKKIRLRGQGEPSASGGPAGDLLITITVANHPFFNAWGRISKFDCRSH